MIGRIVLVASVILASDLPTPASAQDVPGIEICTVEKTMERRTSCLQSNVDFLMKTIAKLGGDHQQKLDAANRQIDGLKSAVVSLQKTVDDLRGEGQRGSEEEDRRSRRRRMRRPRRMVRSSFGARSLRPVLTFPASAVRQGQRQQGLSNAARAS